MGADAEAGAVALERITVAFSGRPRAVLRSEGSARAGLDARRTIERMEARTYLWQLWSGRNWPCTAQEEAAFAEDLRARTKAKGKVKFERHDITSVLNALRCGLTAEELLDAAPGLKPARLLAAYSHLDALRLKALGAWDRITSERSLEALVDWSAAAAVLLPVPIRHMSPCADRLDEGQLAARIDRVVAEVDRVVAKAAGVEELMAKETPGSAAGVELGRLLYDPYVPALWGEGYYLPVRVGTLVPVRVADLLGERRV